MHSAGKLFGNDCQLSPPMWAYLFIIGSTKSLAMGGVIQNLIVESTLGILDEHSGSLVEMAHSSMGAVIGHVRQCCQWLHTCVWLGTITRPDISLYSYLGTYHPRLTYRVYRFMPSNRYTLPSQRPNTGTQIVVYLSITSNCGRGRFAHYPSPSSAIANQILHYLPIYNS